jgi:hypothetical protein
MGRFGPSPVPPDGLLDRALAAYSGYYALSTPGA